MAQLITKFGYLKDNKTRSRGGYAKYIATREGVESSGVEGYMEYMATRPRVEKQGSHGLFTGARQSVVLSQVAKELDAHRGNIWTAIYSCAGRTPSAWASIPLPAGGPCSAPRLVCWPRG